MRCVSLVLAAVCCCASCTVPHGKGAAEDHVSGTYSGPFMGSPLELQIRERRGDSVFGESRHREQQRALRGTLTRAAKGFALVLDEPGDSPYDGRFEAVLDTLTMTLSGSWKPRNNPELSETAFELKQETGQAPGR